MPSPFDAYSEGYAKGKTSTAGDTLAEMTMGMLRDDPGGHFAAGYRDGAGGKKFTPPSPEVTKAAPRKSAGASATPLEKAWWALCDSSAFIPQHVYEYYATALKAQGSQVALLIGLSKFTAHTCPKCGADGQFKIRFLGRLEHPECHWTGYMGTGSYIGFQLSQILHSGYRAGGSMKEDSDRKGDRSGGWIYGVFVFLIVAVFRAALAVALIPLHAVVALCQSGQTGAEIATRVITLCVMVGGLGTLFYKAQHASSTPQFQQVQPAGFSSPGTIATPLPTSRVPVRKVRKADAARVILGKWYPQITFIPHAGATVWDFHANSQVIEYAFVDHNFNSPTRQPVVPERISSSTSAYTISGNTLTIGAGSYPQVYKIVRFTPSELVVVNTLDKSPQPFQQSFGRTWQWAMLP